ESIEVRITRGDIAKERGDPDNWLVEVLVGEANTAKHRAVWCATGATRSCQALTLRSVSHDAPLKNQFSTQSRVLGAALCKCYLNLARASQRTAPSFSSDGNLDRLIRKNRFGSLHRLYE